MFSGGYIHVFNPSHALQFSDDVGVVETNFFYQLLKILRLFPSPNLGWPVEQSILTVALFGLPAAWELRWASENGDQKSRFGHCLGLYISI